MLILVRHGESTYNAAQIITGNFDAPLTEHGRKQAREQAEALCEVMIDYAFCSPLERAHETLTIYLDTLHQHPPVTVAPELIERDLGTITGRPESEFPSDRWREWFSWDGCPDGGESYHTIHDRLIPWFKEHILPLSHDKNVLVVSHNAIMKVLQQFLEHLSVDIIGTLNTPNGSARWYEVAADGSARLVKAPDQGETHE